MLAAFDAVGLRGVGRRRLGVDARRATDTGAPRPRLALDITHATLERALSALETLDYRVGDRLATVPVELAAPSARWVHLHPMVFDNQGTGWQVHIDDLPPFRYPPHAFTGGLINGPA